MIMAWSNRNVAKIYTRHLLLYSDKIFGSLLFDFCHEPTMKISILNGKKKILQYFEMCHANVQQEIHKLHTVLLQKCL